MKSQMRFQKYVCLAMLLAGVLGLLYAFFYCSGGLAELGQAFDTSTGTRVSLFTAAEGKNGAELFNDIQGFNNALMYCGIVMIVLAVLLYVAACHKRRNYYVTNYIATGLCAVGDLVMAVVLMVMNGMWRSEFLNVDFDAWYSALTASFEGIYTNEQISEMISSGEIHYSESTLWFNVGFVVYALIIVASLVLILNLVWKIKLMQGEKKLLNGSNAVAGGVSA